MLNVQRVLRDLLGEKVPKVIAHMDALEMDISLFSFTWFITIFNDNIPISTVLRIWDVFLSEGSKVRGGQLYRQLIYGDGCDRC